jgi:hypothetical protein
MAQYIPYSEPEELLAKLAALPPEANVSITIDIGDIDEGNYAYTSIGFPKEDAELNLSFLFDHMAWRDAA